MASALVGVIKAGTLKRNAAWLKDTLTRSTTLWARNLGALAHRMLNLKDIPARSTTVVITSH